MSLAKKGQGRVEPNPCVGAVLFDEKAKKLVSWGYHKFFGGFHAEAHCLKDITSAKNLTMVVTLEPCSHIGKTPPCADLLLEKKLSKLIYVSKDPNPKVSGSGLKRLEENGVLVEKAPNEYDILNRRLNARFFYAFENKQTFIHLKWAQTLDGKMSYQNEKKWITSESSRHHSQYLRGQSQIVIVGKNTVISDDPSLNVRLKNTDSSVDVRANKVAIIDPLLELENKLDDTNLVKVRDKKDILFIATKKSQKFETIILPKNSEADLDLSSFSEILFNSYNIQSAFVEGGAKTLEGFIKQQIFNQISVYVAPLFFGGLRTQGPTDELNLLDLSLINDLNPENFEKGFIGNDLIFNFYR